MLRKALMRRSEGRRSRHEELVLNICVFYNLYNIHNSKSKNNLRKTLTKFVICCELFQQLRTPSFQKTVNTLKEQSNYSLR
jgi:hypothetical protein